MTNNLVLYRKRARVRQLDLAQKLGVAEQMVSKWETNRASPTIEVMVDIARILNVDPAEIWPEVFVVPIKKEE